MQPYITLETLYFNPYLHTRILSNYLEGSKKIFFFSFQRSHIHQCYIETKPIIRFYNNISNSLALAWQQQSLRCTNHNCSWRSEKKTQNIKCQSIPNLGNGTTNSCQLEGLKPKSQILAISIQNFNSKRYRMPHLAVTPTST